METVISEFSPDVIYHLAAQASGGVSLRNPYLTYTVNFAGTVNLIEAVRKHDETCHIIIPSSSDVYGKPDYLPIDEEHSLKAVNPYSSSKIIMEDAVEQYVKHFKMNITITRSFNHTGRGQDERFFIPSMIKQVNSTKNGDTIKTGNLDIKRDFLDVRDVIKAYISLMNIKNGKYNVCSGKSHKLRDILGFIIELSGRDISVIKDPTRIRKNDPEEIRGTYEKIKSETGWEPRVDIMNTIEWMFNL